VTLARFVSVLLYCDSRGISMLRLAGAIGCTVFLTTLLLSSDPWALLGFEPRADEDVFDDSNDKLYHVIGYFGLSISVLCVGLTKSRRVFTGLAIVAATHAVVIETLQQFFPPRQTDVLDLCANFAGLTLGCGLCVMLRRKAPTADTA
jgi:VanZ family protein